jgi:hypothetical protein
LKRRLDSNQFSGTIKPSMEKLVNLKELSVLDISFHNVSQIISPYILCLMHFLKNGRYLNYNNLTGKIPDGLKNKAGLDLRCQECESIY